MGTAIQPANEAPTGRVMMEATQKATTAFMAAMRWATAGTAITTAKRTPEARKPRWRVYAVRSPAAVPRAKVAQTVAQ